MWDAGRRRPGHGELQCEQATGVVDELSPSSTSTMRRGRPRRLAMAPAAIASVVEITAPRTAPRR